MYEGSMDWSLDKSLNGFVLGYIFFNEQWIRVLQDRCRQAHIDELN